MPNATAVVRPQVDVQAELAYWRGVYADGHLGQYDFSDYAMLLKLGYDVYRAYPHADEAQLYRVMQEIYYRQRPRSSVPWDEARWLVRHAWQRMAQSGRTH